MIRINESIYSKANKRIFVFVLYENEYSYWFYFKTNKRNSYSFYSKTCKPIFGLFFIRKPMNQYSYSFYLKCNVLLTEAEQILHIL